MSTAEAKTTVEQKIRALDRERESCYPGPWSPPHSARLERWLMLFAVYVSFCLVSTLLLALAQGVGFGNNTPNDKFSPPGLPWYIFLYGLLGGCISCIISLLQYPQIGLRGGENSGSFLIPVARSASSEDAPDRSDTFEPAISRQIHPPAFILLTWFVRPFVGASFGTLAYLFLNSGIIFLNQLQPAQHFALCAVISTFAGLCEGRILLKKNKQLALDH